MVKYSLLFSGFLGGCSGIVQEAALFSCLFFLTLCPRTAPLSQEITRAKALFCSSQAHIIQKIEAKSPFFPASWRSVLSLQVLMSPCCWHAQASLIRVTQTVALPEVP